MTVFFTERFIAAKGLNYLVDAIPEVIRNHPERRLTGSSAIKSRKSRTAFYNTAIREQR